MPIKAQEISGFSPYIWQTFWAANTTAILSSACTFFVTTKTSMECRLLQSEHYAKLFIDVLRSNVAARRFQVHDFVMMTGANR